MPPTPRAKKTSVEKPMLAITYCTQCRWLLRAGWTAQELLTTFETELGGVTLCPGTGGVFDVYLGRRRLWSRTHAGRFPELKELKQIVRDAVAPAKALGHSDRSVLRQKKFRKGL